MTPELLELKKKAIDEMVGYMKYGAAEDENDPEYDPDFDAGYTQKHVDQVRKILDEFLSSLEADSDAKQRRSRSFKRPSNRPSSN